MTLPKPRKPRASRERRLRRLLKPFGKLALQYRLQPGCIRIDVIIGDMSIGNVYLAGDQLRRIVSQMGKADDVRHEQTLDAIEGAWVGESK